MEDNEERTLRVQKQQLEMNQVVSNYQRILEASLSSSSSYLTDTIRSAASQSMTYTPMQLRLENSKRLIS